MVLKTKPIIGHGEAFKFLKAETINWTDKRDSFKFEYVDKRKQGLNSFLRHLHKIYKFTTGRKNL